jgi:hypothetical protein
MNPKIILKRFIRIILISVCLLQPAGLLVIYKLQQAFIKCRMQYEVYHRDSGFEYFTFPFKEFHRIQINKHEFTLAGKMYDIKSIQFAGDKILIIAMHDAWEEKIIGLIKQLFKINQHQSNPVSNLILSLITSAYITSELKTNIQCSFNYLIKYPPFNNSLISIGNEVSSPPPEPA